MTMTHSLAIAGALALIAAPVFAQTPAPAPARPAAPAATAPAPAAPAAPVASPVITFEMARLIADSDAGKDMNQKLQAIITAIRGELEPEARAIDAERTRLLQTPASQLQTPAVVQAQEALQRRLQAFAQRQERLSGEAQLTRDNAYGLFMAAIEPVIGQVLTARNAYIVLESQSTFANVRGVDATADMVARLNATTRTINVTRATLPQQGAAAPGGAARPAAPAAAAPAAPAARPATPTPVPAGPLPRQPGNPR